MTNIYTKDRKEIALYNTHRSLGRKFMLTQFPGDYIKWQQALKNYINYKHNERKNDCKGL